MSEESPPPASRDIPALEGPTTTDAVFVSHRRPIPVGAAVIFALLIVAGAASYPWWLPELRKILPAHHPVTVSTVPAPEPAPTPTAMPTPQPSDDEALARRVDQLTASLDRTQHALADLAGKAPDDSAPARLAELSKRLDTLETRPAVVPDDSKVQALTARVVALEGRIGQLQGDSQAGRALALATDQVGQALTTGAPLAGPVAILRSTAANDPVLTGPIDRLAQHADSPMPTRWALLQALSALTSTVAEPAPPPETAGFWARLEARVTGLVTIRPAPGDATAPASADSPERLIANATAALGAGDLAGAVATLRTLTGLDAERVKPWLDAAAARLDAEQAETDLQTEVIRRLGTPDGATP